MGYSPPGTPQGPAHRRCSINVCPIDLLPAQDPIPPNTPKTMAAVADFNLSSDPEAARGLLRTTPGTATEKQTVLVSRELAPHEKDRCAQVCGGAERGRGCSKRREGVCGAVRARTGVTAQG